jgi:endonuclease/exonuclease/phosphatase family metal-dependent hydrolase
LVDLKFDSKEYGAMELKSMKLIFIFVAAFILYAAKIFSAELPAVNFRMLTYNIKGLPPVAAPGWKNDRFPVIAQRLSERLANGTAPDVVVLQEVFTSEAKALVQLSGYPYSAEGPTRDGNGPDGDFQKFYGGGIFILSRYPILETGRANYNDKDCATWDCHANKGVVYVKIRVPGVDQTVTVFDTHMQSGKANDQVRIIQMDVMNRIVSENYKEGELMFYGGDFNSSPDQPSFSVLKSILKTNTAGEYCTQNVDTCKIQNDSSADDVFAKTIDHIFFKGTAEYSVVPVTIERNFRELYGDRPLSDHLGAEALFLIRQNSK